MARPPRPGNANGPEISLTPNYTVSDQFNYPKGSHSMQRRGLYHVKNFQTGLHHRAVTDWVPDQLRSGRDDVRRGELPDRPEGDRNNARALYALLTGRVSSINATGRLAEDGSQYVYNGPITGRETQDDYSFYAQDVWRMKPTVTATLGLRYQYTLPMNPANSVFTTISAEDSCGISGQGTGVTADGATDRFCNMFQPGNIPN